MAKSTRRPQQIYTIVMWLLSIVFAGFLIGLGSLVIKDMPRVDSQISVEDFVDDSALRAIDARLEANEDQGQVLSRAVEDARSAAQEARTDYASAKVSLDNWLATRTATESQAQNPEVIARTRSVEALQNQERAALRVQADAQTALTQFNRAQADIRLERNRLVTAARPEYRKAQNAQTLRVFLYRLALTLPLLIIAGWMIAKKREAAYWPLYRGFVLFALFAFFFELVPYLPSYGGYVRYTVGIIMAVIAGHFIIRSMRRYLDRKKLEESRSEGERRQGIEYETALKKIAAKTCPGCDRSIVVRDGVETDFCVHCGIRLKEKCGNCGERNISFHRFCLSCGTATPAGQAEQSAS
ncbi:zinc ribbon domain-containing protein [Fretibacter rubidus]|uniref:zinc ribbon domain-containing protein n=1 Tax=Fretibacter rubidus TaxID=570162 RepID=UPI00352A45C5